MFFFGAGVFRGSQLLNIVASNDSKMFFFHMIPISQFFGDQTVDLIASLPSENGWFADDSFPYRRASFNLFSGALARRSFLGSVVRETFHLSW